MTKFDISGNKIAKKLAEEIANSLYYERVVNDSSSIFSRVPKEVLLQPDSCKTGIFCGFSDDTVDEIDDDSPAACGSEDEIPHVTIAA